MACAAHIFMRAICTKDGRTCRIQRASSLETQQSMARRRPASDRLAGLARSGRDPATSILSLTLSDARGRGERSPSRSARFVAS
jgi:hypothetical protein